MGAKDSPRHATAPQPRRKTSALEWARRLTAPGRAGDYISPIDTLRPGDKVVLCLRVSGRAQDHNGNLADQETNLRHIAREHGLHVVDVVPKVGSGTDPGWLMRAADKAKQLGAKLLAETVDRLIRHPSYHSRKTPNAQARDDDLKELRECTLGVPLVTVLHPDATPYEVRAYQRKRGQGEKERKGGRPPKATSHSPGYKKARRITMLPQVVRMRRRGATLGEIAQELIIPRATVQKWVEKHA